MNWGELKTAVVSYVHRSDVLTMMPTFLALAEQRIYYGEAAIDPLRIAAMVQSATMVDGTRPARFLAAKRVQRPASPNDRPLRYLPADDIARQCDAFTWVGQTMVLGYKQAFPVSMMYFARFAPLVADSDTNWLTENAPGVYLAALLVEAGKWSRDDALAARSAGDYASAVGALVQADKMAQLSGAMLTMGFNERGNP